MKYQLLDGCYYSAHQTPSTDSLNVSSTLVDGVEVVHKHHLKHEGEKRKKPDNLAVECNLPCSRYCYSKKYLHCYSIESCLCLSDRCPSRCCSHVVVGARCYAW